MRFGMISDKICNLCNTEDETIAHLFFASRISKSIWQHVLKWIDIQHDPKQWQEELRWTLDKIARKGWKANLLKFVITETIYEVWHYRNDIIFGRNTQRNNHTNTCDKFIESILYI